MLAHQAPAELVASLAPDSCSTCIFSTSRPLQCGQLLQCQAATVWMVSPTPSPFSVHSFSRTWLLLQAASPASRLHSGYCFSGDRLLRHTRLLQCPALLNSTSSFCGARSAFSTQESAAPGSQQLPPALPSGSFVGKCLWDISLQIVFPKHSRGWISSKFQKADF